MDTDNLQFTTEELIANYIKDNLTIRLGIKQDDDDYYDFSDTMRTLKVELLLNEEVISSDYITVKLAE